MRLKSTFGMLMLLMLCATASAWAQATGQITGTVTDTSGAVLPGVTVEATNVGTGAVRTAVSGADGLYTLPLLQPGLYNVRASLSGFKAAQQDGVRVTVTEMARAVFELEIGQVTETVTVTAEATLVETSNATHGIVIDQQKVVDLPLNGRNFTQLGTLIPGVVAPPTGLGGQNGDATPGGFGNVTGGFNVNGMRNQSNNFLMDGATNNDTFNTGFVLRPPPDAIEEFKILTHAFGAEFGRNAGAVVNVVTRSGSNTVSGALWEFNRDDALQARNFFAPGNQPKPVLQQNQFGGALGGPLVKNRLFGFGYYEGFRNKSGTTTNILVPSEAQRAGNFGSTTVRDPLTGLPFPNNTIPASRISPVSARLLQEFVPLPNSAGNRYIVSPTLEDVRDQIGVRFDYQFSEKQSMLVRYMRAETDRTTPRVIAAVDQKALATLQDGLVSHNYVWRSNLITQTRASINRISANPAVTSGLNPRDYGINFANTNPLAAGLPSMSVQGFFGGGVNALGDPQQPFVERVNHVWQIAHDVTWIAGRHSLKFGGDVRREAMNIAFINRPNGDLVFNGSISGNSAADFLLGLPAQARATTQQVTQDGYGWLFAGYVQDDFRVAQNLTINLGLRYELPLPFIDKNDAISGFHTGQQSTVYPAAPAGLVYPGDAGVPRGIVPTDKNNFAPRVSVAWDPFGDGRTSVRSAFGVFYDALAGQGDFFQSGVLSPPFTPLVELNTPTPITIADPLAAVAGPPNPFPRALTIIGWGDDFKSPKAYHFNVGVQRQLASRIGAEVAYVGSRGYNLPMFLEINPGVYSPGQTARGARTMPAYALVRPTFSVARSWFDSLQTSLRLLPWKGLNATASYTLGKATDHVSGLNIGGESRPVLPVVQGDQASIDRALSFEKGPALFDARHRFVLSFGYELPGLEDKPAALRAVAGGWQLNGIYQAQTGFPFSVNYGNVLDIRYMTQRPDVVCDPNNGPKTTAKWFDTSCFVGRTLAESGERPGNAGRNSVRGPGFQRTDLSIFKNFDFLGRHRIQARVEAFNVWNQARFSNPSGTFGTAPFGQITSAEDGRVIQLAVKYSF
ncbi:MAG: carboxypeptidase regulatory-like domain-containing protein [Vicinamibacterales bacterium]